MTTKDLVGLWSVDCMYGPGAQGDDFLYLFDDQTGRIEIYNFMLCQYTTFSWDIIKKEIVFSNIKKFNLDGTTEIIPDVKKNFEFKKKDKVVNGEILTTLAFPGITAIDSFITSPKFGRLRDLDKEDLKLPEFD